MTIGWSRLWDYRESGGVRRWVLRDVPGLGPIDRSKPELPPGFDSLPTTSDN